MIRNFVTYISQDKMLTGKLNVFQTCSLYSNFTIIVIYIQSFVYGV